MGYARDNDTITIHRAPLRTISEDSFLLEKFKQKVNLPLVIVKNMQKYV